MRRIALSEDVVHNKYAHERNINKITSILASVVVLSIVP